MKIRKLMRFKNRCYERTDFSSRGVKRAYIHGTRPVPNWYLKILISRSQHFMRIARDIRTFHPGFGL